VTLRFSRLRDSARAPTRAHESDAGYDLYAAEPARLIPGGRAAVATGISLAIPDGHAGLVLPRSGLALRHGITLANAPGLIDPGYRGELKVLLLNTDPQTSFEIVAGDRIGQLVVIRFERGPLEEAVVLESTQRGSAGFGSSGR